MRFRVAGSIPAVGYDRQVQFLSGERGVVAQPLWFMSDSHTSLKCIRGIMDKDTGGVMDCTPCSFDRDEYLAHKTVFESRSIDDPDSEMSEFNEDAEDLAYELAYTRYALAKKEKQYFELLMTVSTKHPGESRHETALRYIQEAERRDGSEAAANKNSGGKT